MKLNSNAPKLAATAVLLATAGAAFTVTPAHAAPDTPASSVADITSKYDTESFRSAKFDSPKTVQWAVAYKATSSVTDQLAPAEKALLQEDVKLAQKQKTITESKAAVVRAEEQRIAAEKAAAEKAERERVEAERVAAEKAAAEKAEQERVEAERVAAEEAAAQQAAQRTTTNTATSTPVSGAATPYMAPVTTPTPAAPITGSMKERMVQIAYQNLGVPYVWGGTTQAGWDCSGMVGFVYNQATGKSLPRTVDGMVGSGMLSATSQPQPGDLVVYSNGVSNYHIGIYVGPGQMIHAPVPGQVTQVSSIWGAPIYYSING